MNLNTINFDKMDGLIPAVVQDVSTREVLMVGFMNREALECTLEEKRVTFWSRSKQRLWQKGETSGNTLELVEARLDCDDDTVLVLARPMGPTCHTGERTCFGEKSLGMGFLGALDRLIAEREKLRPEGSYTTTLFNEGLDKILAKVEEESDEVARAAFSESDQRLAEEVGDLFYHTVVLLRARGLSLDAVIDVLEDRNG